MATNDDLYVPRVASGPKGGPHMESLNEIIRQIFTSIARLEGRLGPTGLRNDVNVLGEVASEGVNSSGNVLGVPVVAGYTKTTTTAGIGFYTWDTSDTFNDADYYSLNTTQDNIAILRSGLYLIHGSAIATADGAGTLQVLLVKNGSVFLADLFYASTAAGAIITAPFSAIAELEANDYVGLYLNTGGGRIGDTFRSSAFYLQKLN